MSRWYRWIPVLALLGLSTTASFGPIPPGPSRPKGSLVIVGGGSRTEAMMRRFVELAGGPGRARIAVVPMSSSEPQATGDGLVAEFDSLGARGFVFLVDSTEAESETAVRRLDSVTGIWFAGGDQARHTAALGGTAALRAMQRRYQEGAVLGGTSAGAAIMSDSMLTGNQTPPGDTTGYYGDDFPTIARQRIQVVPGLGFLPGAIVDQHFIRRERHNRLISAVLERPSLIGVGIDESTALEVGPDGRWRVLGESSVVVYDARDARVTARSRPLLGAMGVRVHILPPGGLFDPRTGRGTL
ncbi:MAG TPA: cyanophycinase [Gemmatimonadales bacterium]|jgi:cyanophycinase|nr:cyanophycinase [Gemmatimonadales bacterium]